MEYALNGWSVELKEFKAADRDFQPVTSEALARVVLEQIGVKLEWTTEEETGAYVVTLTNALHEQLISRGFIEFEFRTRDGVFRLEAEFDEH